MPKFCLWALRSKSPKLFFFYERLINFKTPFVVPKWICVENCKVHLSWTKGKKTICVCELKIFNSQKIIHFRKQNGKLLKKISSARTKYKILKLKNRRVVFLNLFFVEKPKFKECWVGYFPLCCACLLWHNGLSAECKTSYSEDMFRSIANSPESPLQANSFWGNALILSENGPKRWFLTLKAKRNLLY